MLDASMTCIHSFDNVLHFEVAMYLCFCVFCFTIIETCGKLNNRGVFVTLHIPICMLNTVLLKQQ